MVSTATGFYDVLVEIFQNAIVIEFYNTVSMLHNAGTVIISFV